MKSCVGYWLRMLEWMNASTSGVFKKGSQWLYTVSLQVSNMTGFKPLQQYMLRTIISLRDDVNGIQLLDRKFRLVKP